MHGTVRSVRKRHAIAIVFSCLFAVAADAQAAVALPRISLVPKYAGFSFPVQVTDARDGSGILYVVEQGGRIRLVKNGALQATSFLDISDRVLFGGEQGLLGLAFPPGYATKRHFYLNYTRIPDGSTVISRYRLTVDPDSADPASEEILLVIPQPFANHNGGQITFGPDGFLYIAMGDGGSGGDPENNAQNPASLLGKILRIDVESAADPGLLYAIPPSNPFVQTQGFRGEIWALGFRNPWRFSFDRQTGDLYIGDVGQGSFEEVDFQPAGSPGGENYGWRIMEGAHCFGDPACSQAGLVLPVAEYDHGQGCSITGGFVYRGTAYPRMQGVYLYADFCTGNFWGLKRDGADWQNELLLSESHNVSSFGEDEEGNLFVADLSSGSVLEIITPNNPPAAPALISPADATTEAPTTVSFEWIPSVDPDGDQVSYRFFLGTDPSFAGVVPVPVARTGDGKTAEPFKIPNLPALLPVALFLSGILFAKKPARLAGILFLAGIIGTFGIAGCGGGSSGSPAAASGSVTHIASGLAAGTTYYWKVEADDGLDTAASPTRSFTTGN
jgi:glucose/arabinose dehydrogenase